MIMEVLKYPHPVLRKISEPVNVIDSEIGNLAADMLETMYAEKGVGLAAPQIGKNIRLIVMDPKIEGVSTPRVLINPKLKCSGDIIVSEQEGCLSVPMGYRADVNRYSQVELTYLDLQGNEHTETLEGFEAIIVQHENDHLDGKLFIDNIGHLRRMLFEGKLKKWMKSQK